MKVLHVIPRLSIRCGGPVKALLGLAAAQAKAGLHVRILATDHWYEGHSEIPGCEIKVFPCLTGLWQWSPAMSKALPAEIAWADIVNVHTLWSHPVQSASRACRTAEVPYVLRPAGMLDQWSLSQKRWKKRVYASLIERRTINGAAAVWFTSEEERKSASSFIKGTTDFVTPLGVTAQDYLTLPSKGTFRTRFLDDTTGRVILFLGRLNPVKQLALVLQAFAELHRENSDSVLVIAGPDEDGHLSDVEGLARSLGVREKTFFTGGLQKTDVIGALTDADVFVLPSRHENFGMSAVEAMAAGLPVIVSDQVGLASFVREAEAGIVIGPTKEALASALRYLLSNPSAARLMGERGRALVLKKFAWESIVPKITDAYESAIRASRNGHN